MLIPIQQFMPQLDLFSYFSAATYLILSFLVLIFILHTYYLPKNAKLFVATVIVIGIVFFFQEFLHFDESITFSQTLKSLSNDYFITSEGHDSQAVTQSNRQQEIAYIIYQKSEYIKILLKEEPINIQEIKSQKDQLQALVNELENIV